MNQDALSKAACMLVVRAGMSHEEAESLLRQLVASVQPSPKQKLEGKDSED